MHEPTSAIVGSELRRGRENAHREACWPEGRVPKGHAGAQQGHRGRNGSDDLGDERKKEQGRGPRNRCPMLLRIYFGSVLSTVAVFSDVLERNSDKAKSTWPKNGERVQGKISDFGDFSGNLQNSGR